MSILIATIPVWWVLLLVAVSFGWSVWTDRYYRKQLEYRENDIERLKAENERLRELLDETKYELRKITG